MVSSNTNIVALVKRMIVAIFLILLLLYTQLHNITAVPGFHFDEAWQSYYAWRISAEPGFWPIQAMNSYTWPVVHYILAFIFKIFGASIAVERYFYSAIQVASALILAQILRIRVNSRSAGIFLILWSLMPYFVHNHRFYVEMTGFFLFCFSLGLAGLHLWKKNKAVAGSLIMGSSLLGVYSHILYLSVIIAFVLIWLSKINRQAHHCNNSTALVLATLAASLIPAVFMHLHFNKLSTFLLCTGLIFLILGIFFSQYFKLSANTRWQNFSQFISLQVLRLFALIAMPFLPAFFLLFWEGPWNYAQVTGNWNIWFLLPVHITLAVVALRTGANSPDRPLLALTLVAFILLMAISSLMILKQSPRYYTVPATLLLIAVSIGLSRLNHTILALVITPIVIWNLYLFQENYISRFQQHGAKDAEYRFLIFKDSPRDMRPFQKVFSWLDEQGCLNTLDGVENDRFLFPLKFFKVQKNSHQDITKSTAPSKVCPWKNSELAFRTIPTTQEGFPANLRLLAHHPTWGDLAIWYVEPIK